MSSVINKSQIIEENIILLLGVKSDKPIPSVLHLEKEMFLLTRAIPELNDTFKFVPHYDGPRSQLLRDQLAKPLSYKHPWLDKDGIRLTENGKDAYKDVIIKIRGIDSPNYVGVFKLVRAFYDDITEDEFLLLIYDSYRDYWRESNISGKINEERKLLSANLLKKSIITKSRYKELVAQAGA
jgi:hypothetical protein